MSAWQPIETAPKDGTPILVYSREASDPQIVLASWREYQGSPDDGGWYDWWDNNAPEIDATVTHWQPLPEPPA